MMKVSDLLNPAPAETAAESSTTRRLERPLLALLQTQLEPASRPSKQKLAKDAPIFRKGPTKGEVVFPPHEAGDDKELAAKYEHYQIFPRGEIAAYCHHIPYSSDKKTFLTKTGRDAFEVFQYTFKMPNAEKEYVVMWDYNIGLVRITPFFKCLKYSKTTPAKVLNMNPGLRDITHSITGGALTAQGYWMPFDCAKAVAATFCYELRHALVPVFGKEFLDICVPTNDAMYGSFRIDPEITKTCTTETRKWLQRADARFTPSSSREPSEMPGTPRSGTALPMWKKIKPRTLASAASPESGYETGTDTSAQPTPNMSPQASWVSINRPRAETPHSAHEEVTAAASLLMLSSPKSAVMSYPNDIPRSVSTLTTPEKRAHASLEEDEISESCGSAEEKASPGQAQKDSNAALTLLQLRSPPTAHEDVHREKRQRRSSAPPQVS